MARKDFDKDWSRVRKIRLYEYEKIIRRLSSASLFIPLVFTLGLSILQAWLNTNEWYIDALDSFYIPIVADIVFCFMTFLVVVLFVAKLQSRVYDVGEYYSKVKADAQGFFCTSIMPTVLPEFRNWYSHDSVSAFAKVVNHKKSNSDYMVCRLFIYERNALEPIHK